MTIDTALKIEAATGISANIWRGLQSDYDMQTARRDNWTTYVKRLQFYNAIFVSGNIIFNYLCCINPIIYLPMKHSV